MPLPDSRYFDGKRVDAVQALHFRHLVICELNALTDGDLRSQSIAWISRVLHTEFRHIDARYCTLDDTRETLQRRADSALHLNKLFIALTISPSGSIVPVGTASLVERDYPEIQGTYPGWLADRVVDAGYRKRGEFRSHYEKRFRSFKSSGPIESIGDALRVAVVHSVDDGGVRHYTEHEHVRKSAERSGFAYASTPCVLRRKNENGDVVETRVFVGSYSRRDRRRAPTDEAFFGKPPEWVEIAEPSRSV